MNDDIKRLSEARQSKGWTDKEIDEFAKRRAKELKKIASDIEEPDYLASGTKEPTKDKDNTDE